jgi:eukaryotic-like serine/threonine-protein kinase
MGELVAERYELQRLLGRGGMSEVWLARDRELDRAVAVKLHAPGADPARFVREAKAAAQLSHPNIATVYDFGTAAQGPFLVVEYLPEQTLEDRLAAETPLPDDQTERVARDVAEGLAHAHAGGVVHRDLKPSNVLFDVEGRAKISDFGIARALGEPTLTETGTVLGTAGYISPEQAAGEPAGPSSDVYSFGVILYRMLTGRLPFEGASAVEVAIKHQADPPPPIESYRGDAPRPLALLAEAALAKTPNARPQTGAELVAALAGTAAVAPASDSTVETLVVHPRRAFPSTRLVGAGLGVFAVFVAGGLAAVFVSGSPGGKQSSSESRSDGSGNGPALATTRSTSAASTTAESRTIATSTASHTTPRHAQTRRAETSGLTTTAPATTEETTAPATTETAPTASGVATAP